MRPSQLGLYFSLLWTALAQNSPTTSTSSADGTASSTTTSHSLGVLSLITPTVKLSDVQASDSSSFVSDASSFYRSYTNADAFQFLSVWEPYIRSLQEHSDYGRISSAYPTYAAYYSNLYSVLDDPTRCMSSLRSLITIFPYTAQSSILSQATEVLSGFMSLATRDVLKQNVTRAPVTPGATVDVGLASPTSREGGVPAATAGKRGVVAAAGAAVGVCGAVLLL